MNMEGIIEKVTDLVALYGLKILAAVAVLILIENFDAVGGYMTFCVPEGTQVVGV